jgi:superfamily II DNA or RNA helicase
MSIIAKYSDLSPDLVDSINADLVLSLERNKYSTFSHTDKKIYAFTLNPDNTVTLPFAYAIEMGLSRRPRSDFSQRKVAFTGTLRDQQTDVYSQGMEAMNKRGHTMLSLYTGFGKTFLSIKLSTVTKLRTLIIVNKIVLMKQWEEAIKKVCPEATIHVLKKQEDLKDCDFYIINAINVSKRGMGYFRDMGTVIVDECHLIMAECLSKCLHYLSPRYLIGLSATPYRTDGMDPLLGFHFGEEKIMKLMSRKHTVYKVVTGFVPDFEYTADGKVNWGSLLDSQCNNRLRNELIIQIVKRNKDRNILILSKRIEQGTYLYNRLQEEGESVTSLIGKQQDFDTEARVLVGTTSKCGTGFDFPKLDCLILASDIQQYYIQALGRVLRRPDVEPIVFDLLDENPILRIHYETRAKVYREIGGTVKMY